jgi:hypothetical protein
MPSHLNLCDFMDLTMSSPYSNLLISSLYHIFHELFSITGPYILCIIFLSNILSMFSSVTVIYSFISSFKWTLYSTTENFQNIVRIMQVPLRHQAGVWSHKSMRLISFSDAECWTATNSLRVTLSRTQDKLLFGRTRQQTTKTQIASPQQDRPI